MIPKANQASQKVDPSKSGKPKSNSTVKPGGKKLSLQEEMAAAAIAAGAKGGKVGGGVERLEPTGQSNLADLRNIVKRKSDTDTDTHTATGAGAGAVPETVFQDLSVSSANAGGAIEMID
jgi:hypothetical protein